MKYRLKLITCLSLIVLLILLSSFAQAYSPMCFVKQILDKVMTIQTNPKFQGSDHHFERAMGIKRIITENFDSRRMARQSLQAYWSKVSAKDKKKFSEIFADLFQDSYTRLVLNFLKKETIEYLDNHTDGERALVKTAIVRANDKIKVDYYLHYKNKRWFIDDVSIDGVSIVGNYQSMFRQEIARNSFNSLLKKMEVQQKVIRNKMK